MFISHFECSNVQCLTFEVIFYFLYFYSLLADMTYVRITSLYVVLGRDNNPIFHLNIVKLSLFFSFLFFFYFVHFLRIWMQWILLNWDPEFFVRVGHYFLVNEFLVFYLSSFCYKHLGTHNLFFWFLESTREWKTKKIKFVKYTIVS